MRVNLCVRTCVCVRDYACGRACMRVHACAQVRVFVHVLAHLRGYRCGNTFPTT